MRSGFGFVAVGAAVALIGFGTAEAKMGAPDVPKCALGRLPAPLHSVVPQAIAAGERRFASSLEGVGRRGRTRARRAFASGTAAYLFGMPTVLLRLTVTGYPLNALVGIAELATPATRTVVAPNHDTLYSVSRLDLSAGPLMIDAPATGGRYSVLQLLDAYTNVIDYVGAGRERNHDRTVAVLPPGWHGTLPAGVRPVRSPTKLVWLLGRTLVDGPDDVPAAKALMERYSLTPLGDWRAGQRNEELVLDAFPGNQRHVELPRGLAFYDALGDGLAADPPPSRDDCAVRAFARVGIGPGLATSDDADQMTAEALSAAYRAGERLVDRAAAVTQRASRRHHNGWSFSPPDTGRFGTDYSHRAVVASKGLAANVRSQALYPHVNWDSRGRPLRGSHEYVVHFRRGELPPVRAFWSLTMYNRSLFLVPNPIDRYAVGDRTPGLHYGPHGSLRIYVQHDPPSARHRANWLPAPAGRFEMHLRLYEPKRAATSGHWTPPRVSRTR